MIGMDMVKKGGETECRSTLVWFPVAYSADISFSIDPSY